MDVDCGQLFSDRDWLSEDVLHPLWELNGQFLQRLLKCVPPEQPSLTLACTLRRQLITLKAPTRERLARGPLLLDAGFADKQRWMRALENRGRTAQDDSTPAPPPWLPREDAVLLSRSTGLLAWHVVRSHPELAEWLLGISPPCATFFTALGLAELQELSERYCDWLRPRWEDHPDVWHVLIEFVRRTEDLPPWVVTLRTLQLFAGQHGSAAR